jgi:hypothetical protein
VSGGSSYVSRFAVKFLEIMAAAVATAVSGYIVAHFTGYFPSSVPLPAAVQVTPSASSLSVNPTVQPAVPMQSATSAEAERPAPAQDAAPSPRARAAVTAAPATSPRKRAGPEANPAESKPRDAESVEARVRAALAKVDGTRPSPPVTPPPRQANVSPAPVALIPPPASVPQPRPTDPTTVAAVPHVAEPQPAPQSQSAQQAPGQQTPAQTAAMQKAAPIQPEPLSTTVEIKSRPVASVGATPMPERAPVSEEEKGLLSALKKIPDLLRSDSPPATEVPRPPMPVGD